MAYELKITVYDNVDYSVSFTVKDSDGIARDITGYKMLFGIGNDERTLIAHDSSSASNLCCYITDASNGVITLKLPHEVLQQLKPGIYNHDCILVNGSNEHESAWTGTIRIRDGMARNV